MKHLTTLPYKTDLKELAEDIGNLQYDSLAEFLQYLSDKLKRDCVADLKRKRPQLSIYLFLCSTYLNRASEIIKNTWRICKPYMNEDKNE